VLDRQLVIEKRVCGVSYKKLKKCFLFGEFVENA
jgi:hypothetical protein